MTKAAKCLFVHVAQRRRKIAFGEFGFAHGAVSYSVEGFVPRLRARRSGHRSVRIGQIGMNSHPLAHLRSKLFREHLWLIRLRTRQFRRNGYNSTAFAKT